LVRGLDFGPERDLEDTSKVKWSDVVVNERLETETTLKHGVVDKRRKAGLGFRFVGRSVLVADSSENLGEPEGGEVVLVQVRNLEDIVVPTKLTNNVSVVRQQALAAITMKGHPGEPKVAHVDDTVDDRGTKKARGKSAFALLNPVSKNEFGLGHDIKDGFKDPAFFVAKTRIQKPENSPGKLLGEK